MARRKSGGLRNLLRGLPSYEVGGYADRGYESESPADTGPSLSDVGIDSSRPGSFSDFGPATSDGRTSSTDYGGGRDYGRSTDVSAGTSRGSSRSSDNDVGTTRGGSFSDFGPATDDGRTSNTDYGGMSDYGRDTGYGFADPGGGFMGYGASDFPSDFIGPHNSQLGGGSSGENYANSWGADSARYGGSQASPDLHFGESDPGFADRSYPGWGRTPMEGDDGRGTYMTEPGTLVGREQHSFPLDPRDFPSQIPTIALASNVNWDAPERELDGVLTDSRSKGRFGTSGVTSSDVFGFDNVAPGTQAPSGPLGAAQAAFAGQQAPQMPSAPQGTVDMSWASKAPNPQADLNYGITPQAGMGFNVKPEAARLGYAEDEAPPTASFPATMKAPNYSLNPYDKTSLARPDVRWANAVGLTENRTALAKGNLAGFQAPIHNVVNRAAVNYGRYGPSVEQQARARSQYSGVNIKGKEIPDGYIDKRGRKHEGARSVVARNPGLAQQGYGIAKDILSGLTPDATRGAMSFRGYGMQGQMRRDPDRVNFGGNVFGNLNQRESALAARAREAAQQRSMVAQGLAPPEEPAAPVYDGSRVMQALNRSRRR
jgi:hypothetical protein